MSTPKVSQLVPLSREMKADDTMRQFHQIIRFQAVLGSPLRVQLVLDRKHKENAKLSKPAAWVRMSNTSQLLDLGCGALAMANVLALRHKTSLSKEDVTAAVNSVLDLVRGDVINLTQIMFRDLEEKEGEE